jgi:hypothetical protein
MLEHSTLLVRPRGAAPVQAIVAADTGAPLGLARWTGGEAPPWWWPFDNRVLAVHEYEDEPLLFTVRRCWGLVSCQEVRDAEGHRVGTLAGSRVRNRFGRKLAVLCREGRGTWAFRGLGGEPLARVTGDERGRQVAFGPGVEGDPFAKMLLLAAVLSTKGLPPG